MCGIAGLVGRPDGRGVVTRMTEMLRHRGPDGGGMFVDEAAGVALGHRRLAVLDLSEAGRQPMTSRDGRWTIVLNGEIFNYLELRAALGCAPRTATDTEVLLEACAAWGVERTLARCVGMFAFALWDAKDRKLMLARDRFGEKPLTYHWDGKALTFSSELKALGEVSERRLDPEAVDTFLALGYVPAPLTIFRDCRKLPPGHLLRFKGGKVEVRRWWFPENAAEIPPKPRADKIAKLRELVSDAVRLRLRADVPIALYLSGGVDSSVIAAECARQGANIAAFTVSFDGETAAPRLTDLPYARRVAEVLGSRHETLRVGGSSVGTQLENMLWHYDEPFADSSALPSFALARALAGRYKVVLSGEGGDEAFGGYRHYEHIRIKQMLKSAAATLNVCDGRGAGPLQIYVASKTTFRAADRGRLLNGNGHEGALERLLASDVFLGQTPRAGALKRALWSDRHLYLPNDLTYKTDIALASAGIEGRAPFLDHRLLEWTQSLPPRDLVRASQKKILLRAAYRDELPAEILNRPKHGFGAPVDKWLRGPLRELAGDMVPCPLLDPVSQRGLSGQRLWTLVAFASWARHWGAAW